MVVRSIFLEKLQSPNQGLACGSGRGSSQSSSVSSAVLGSPPIQSLTVRSSAAPVCSVLSSARGERQAWQVR